MAINWTVIENDVSTDFHVRRDYITALRKGFLDGGHIYIFGGDDRGPAAEGTAGCPSTKFNKDILKDIEIYADGIHSKGKDVISNGVKCHLLPNFGVDVHQKTCCRAVKRIGLNWIPIKKTPRTYASYRVQPIREFLIDLDKYCVHR